MKLDAAVDPARRSRPKVPARIVIVESDAETAGRMGRTLADAGFVVDVMAPRKKILKRIREREPRMVIAEVLSPELDGFALCRQLKRSPGSSQVRVLLSSFLAAEARALEAGADGFLPKPVSERRLIELVRSVLGEGALKVDPS